MQTNTLIDNRITRLFKEKNQGVLNIYFTAGFPQLNDTLTVLTSLQEAGADMVEIGIPFSDPLADGPTIQKSNDVALHNGMTLNLLFEQLKEMRKNITIPVLLMGYLNPVMQYGIEKFCEKAKEVGVDGIILPDLPIVEYNELYKEAFEANNLSNVFLVTPHTSEERIKLIDQSSQGFIYVVSTDSTTGNTKNIISAESYLKRVKGYTFKNPTMVGFNISDYASYHFATQYANGAIIGSAFIKMLKESKNISADIKNFVLSIKKS